MTRRIVLLLANPASYRLTVFREAAVTIGLEPIVGYPAEAGAPTSPNVLSLDFADPALAATALGTLTQDSASDFRLIAVDDTAVELAANLNQLLNLPGNSVDSAHASRDKITMRRRFAAAGLPDPEMHPFDPSLAHDVAEPLPYPIVVKPAGLNGSRGVIRANDRTEFLHASALLADILRTEAIGPSTETALWERFIPGTEVAIEAMLTDGHLVVLAIFDKPDPLDGPFFEETIYVTPSRLPGVTQEAVAATVAAMADAIGLRHGPIHAEVRINEDGVWPIEIASRSIGGMCATVLEFGAGMSLEELILRHAFGETVTPQRTTSAVGAMMIPVPAEGILRGWEGGAEAQAVPGIAGIDITAKIGLPIRMLPAGESYLGFIFATGDSPEFVESALRRAHSCLRFDFAPMLHLRAN